MEKDEVIATVDRINEYLKECLWMDFELVVANDYEVVICGYIDRFTGDECINIRFELPFYISSFFSWPTDTKNVVISLCTNEKELREMNTKYRIEAGNYVFKINVEDFSNPPILVIAKKIFCEILKRKPFN